MFAVLLSTSALPAQAAWFRFSTAFIGSHHVNGEAFSTVGGTKWTRSALHDISCSGKDGEVHIGAFETDLDPPSSEAPVSGPGDGSNDPEWGVVAELPNAAEGDGLATYDAHATGKVCSEKLTFEGYLRVWNEGHAGGNSSGSNPHHVLEMHPAWAFDVGGDHFADRSLVKRVPGYSGYRASAFRSMLTTIGKKAWPRAYEENGALVLELRQHHNFYQLPVIVRSTQAIPGGHEVIVDVFSD